MPHADSILDCIVARTRRLYSLPAVAVRVLELTSQEPLDPRELKNCLEKDPALAGKIMRVANSSLFGLRTQVSSLPQAIELLGPRSLKMLVLGFSLPVELTRDVPCSVLRRFWKHTLYRALAARRFAQDWWQLPGDDAFLAGLLGGVGMLALIQDLGQTYTVFLDHLYDHGGDLTEQELAVLGFDHAVLSARMLVDWGLPPQLIRAVTRPRQVLALQSLASEEHPLASALHLAELTAEFLITERPPKLAALVEDAAQLKSVSASQVHEKVAELEAEANQLAELFNIDPPKRGSFEQLISEAQASLAELAEESLLAGCDPQLSEVLEQTRVLHSEMELALARGSKPLVHGEQNLRGDAPRSGSRGPLGSTAMPARGETALASRVVLAVEECRERRCPLSLVIATLDAFAETVADLGPEAAERLVRQLSRSCYSVADDASRVLAVGEARFALLLVNCDRSAAVAAARELLNEARRACRGFAASASRPIKISLGVATVTLPPRNFSVQELIEAARRCLSAAQSSGGDAVKSIEI